MSILLKLKTADCLDDVATLLGFKPASLAYVLYRLPAVVKYTQFSIPKRAGGVRSIKAPEPRLKLLQRRLANLLYVCLEEIDRSGPPRRPLAHGFVPCMSIITNASVHKRRRYILNLDLKDFFPSINFGRVRGLLIKDKRFGLHPKVATVIAQIACDDVGLPQGSPCSPVLSNIVANLLDIRLVRLAKEHKCTYSRYADDITFSTSRGDFPTELAQPVSATTGKWEIGAVLAAAISNAGFEVNNAKTRMQIRASRQIVTGLLVNEKVNIRPEYYRTVRSMCSSLFATGSYHRLVAAPFAGGQVGAPSVKEILPSLDSLQGRLEHIYHVRDSVDHRSRVLKKKEGTATRRLYSRFLFYKSFVALDATTILSEGKTDIIYLRAAMERLTMFHPALGSMDKGSFRPAVKFMRYTETVHDILQLGGGTGDFKHFIINYTKNIGYYKHKPMAHPVIILIDNDDGAKEIFAVAKNHGAGVINHSSSASFYKLPFNLYLVKTPENIKSTVTSCIEDLFEPAVLATKLNGKEFDPYKDAGDDTKYGKVPFAEKVIKPNVGSINFDGFGTLLERILAVMADFGARDP